MAAVPAGNEIHLAAAAAWTVIVPAPAVGHQHQVSKVSVVNLDSVAITVEVRKVKGANNYIVGRIANLGVNTTGIVVDRLVTLDATDETLEVRMTTAITLTAPDADAAYLNVG